MEDNTLIKSSLSATINAPIEMVQRYVEEKGDGHENR
jgi:hypothetical protein